MGFDWQEFAKTGISPAVKMYQDYFTGGMRSQLSRQQYQQNISQLQITSKLREQEREKDYVLDKMLEDVKHSLRRSEYMDKDFLSRAKDSNKHKNRMTELQFGRETQELRYKLQHQNSVYNYGEMKDIAKINNGLYGLETANPELVNNMVQVNRNKNFTNYMQLNEQIQVIQNEDDADWNSAGRIELQNRLLMNKTNPIETPFSDDDRANLNSYNDRHTKHLEKSRELQFTQNEVKEQIIRTEMGHKFGKLPPHTPEQLQFLTAIGCPLPHEDRQPNPKAIHSVDVHIDFIRKCRLYNYAIPKDAELIQAGLDPLWLQNNWNTYWQYFTANPSLTVKEQFETITQGKKK